MAVDVAVWIKRVVAGPAGIVGIPAGALLAIVPAGIDMGKEADTETGELAAAVEEEAGAAALEEPLVGDAPDGAIPHAVGIGLFPGSLSNGAAALPRSSGTVLGTVHLVPSGLTSTPGHVSVALSPVLHDLIMLSRTPVSQPAS